MTPEELRIQQLVAELRQAVEKRLAQREQADIERQQAEIRRLSAIHRERSLTLRKPRKP